MLKDKELKEIREFLENSQNPLFFFDNDVDGLCSFLILQRAIGRGKGIAIRSFPELSSSYLRKIDELNPDAIFILDKPKVGEDFIDEVYSRGLPIIWIDHHETDISKNILNKVSYYNSFPSSEPVTFLAYSAAQNKKDMWLAMIGCIGDIYKPGFAQEFSEMHPEFYNSELNAFDSLFASEVGKAVRILNFGLKDSVSNVVKMIKYLMKATGLTDVLEENKHTKQMHYKYKQLNSVLEKLLNKAELNVSRKILFFKYSGETSMSSELANHLYFKHRTKLVVVAYSGQDKINISIRGKNAKKITGEAIADIEGASGGGHEEATGARIPAGKLDEFKKKIEELVENIKL